MDKVYCVYTLISEKDNSFYIGMSGNIDRRLIEHNSGKVRSTKSRRPLKLFYKEVLNSRKEAREKEKFLKSGYGREFLKLKLSQMASVAQLGLEH